jgi:hypothetical protein
MATPRGGRRRPPELRGTLGTLIRTTLAQAGVVREVLERGAREGKARIDEVRSRQERTELLAQIGELMVERWRNQEALAPDEDHELQALLEQAAELDEADGDERIPARAAPRPAMQRPPRPRINPARVRAAARDTDDDDGTVSSAGWRPVAAHLEPQDEARAPAASPLRKGGIDFGDDDEDLAEYMHPDDVPER